jgi:predicted DCC family thiol-disulfide oxidoreductase YuxK
MKISPLQGEAAKKLLPTKYIEDLDSFVLYRGDGKTFRKSSAVIGVMNTMSCKYRLLAKLMWCIPRCIRNCFYDLVANYRKDLAKDFCYLPTKEEKLLFID